MGRSGSDNRRRRSRRRAETVSVCATQPSRSNTHLFPATAPGITPSLFIALIIDQRSSVMSRADGNVTTVVQPTAAPPPRRSQLTPASGRSRRAQTDITDRNSTPVMDLFESEAFLLSKDLFLNHPLILAATVTVTSSTYQTHRRRSAACAPSALAVATFTASHCQLAAHRARPAPSHVSIHPFASRRRTRERRGGDGSGAAVTNDRRAAARRVVICRAPIKAALRAAPIQRDKARHGNDNGATARSPPPSEPRR